MKPALQFEPVSAEDGWEARLGQADPDLDRGADDALRGREGVGAKDETPHPPLERGFGDDLACGNDRIAVGQSSPE
ncbi:MAG: hypothetical protein C4335_02250 [Armatimonadota bacterium]